MEVARLIEAFWCLMFLCQNLSDADALLKYTKDDELSGFTCPAEHITFRNENGLSASQCLLLCVERENCYGYFLHKGDGQCIGCKEKFPTNVNYPASHGMLFYRAPLEYMITKYKLVSEYLTWYKAKENCKAFGGQLVQFRSNEERKFIEKNILQGYGSGTWLWIDGYDVDYDKVFLWSDDAPVSDLFIKWGPNQPDLDANEQCLSFLNSNGVWSTHDYLCDRVLYSVCEFGL